MLMKEAVFVIRADCQRVDAVNRVLTGDHTTCWRRRSVSAHASPSVPKRRNLSLAGHRQDRAAARGRMNKLLAYQFDHSPLELWSIRNQTRLGTPAHTLRRTRTDIPRSDVATLESNAMRREGLGPFLAGIPTRLIT